MGRPNRKHKVPPAIPQKFPRHTPEEFARRYQELCQQMGFQIAFQPVWARSNDTGDYRLVIQSLIQPMPKPEPATAVAKGDGLQPS